jgi:tetraacyldisaccharide 4'-kinase
MGIKSFLNNWIEQYLFHPNLLQRLISILFFPFTIIYCIVVAYKRATAKAYDFGINVVSIGNLIVGGTGKTPVTIHLARQEKHPAIILRGYKRESKGLYLISDQGKILEGIKISGDEAQEYAISLKNASVIVSENRIDGILKAKELGCGIVFLDDGYRHHNIKKFDILIRPKEEPSNLFCLPSGGYTETKMIYSFVPIVLKDGVDFKRVISFSKHNQIIDIENKKLLLVTAISKPNRLLEYLPKSTPILSFIDHYNYTQDDIHNILTQYQDYDIVTTKKDYVKLEKFNLKNIIIMNLKINMLKKIEYEF